MPTLEDLDTLKAQINRLGDEPRLLAERGETMADVAPSDVSADPDLERLLDDADAGESGIDDMNALLDSYSEDITPSEEAAGEDDFNLDDLMDSISDDDVPVVDDILADADTPPDILGESPVEPVDEVPTLDDITDSFDGLDDLAGLEDLGDLGDIADMEIPEAPGVPDEPGDFDMPDDLEESADLEEPADMEIPEIPEEPGSTGDFDGLDDLESIEGLDALEDLDIAGEPGVEAGDLDTGDDAFSMDDLDDLDLGDVTESPDVEALEAEPADDLPAADMEPEPAMEPEEPGPAAGDDSFDIGDLDIGDLDIGDADAAAEGGGDEELGTLDSLDVSTADFPDTGFSEDEFSLENLDFDDTSGGFDLGTPDEEPGGDEPGSGDDEPGSLEDLGDLGELGELEEGDEAGEIPDVEAAVENLGDADALDDGIPGELSLDEELNFDEELGADVLSDLQETGEDSQQFSMDDFGEQYNFKEGEAGFADNLGVDLEKLEQSLDDATEDEEKPFTLEEEDLADILGTLASLPRNLKIAIEELLADDRRKIGDLKPLIDGLIDGETPKALAARFHTITRRKIDLPRSYEKRSGRDLEARRQSLVYRLVREGWPVIRTVLAIIAVVWVLAAACFMWVYRPIKAAQLYDAGLDAVAVDDVEGAEELFYDAWDGWPMFAAPEGGDRIGDSPVIVKGWKDNGRWLEYARKLRHRKHWDAADRFYAGYLSVRPDARDERLEYAEFLSSVLGRYENAISVLDGAPSDGRANTNRDYMLAAGDVYLRWAEDDPTMYEDARYRYAKVLETSRNDERAILSMMRYHLHVGDDDEISTLLPIFQSEVPGKTREPALAAEVFAGLADWHLVRGDDSEARRFLDLALKADSTLPEPHYVDARYWRSFGDQYESRELEALKRTLVALDSRESMSRSELEMRILTLGGLGRLQYSRSSRFAGSDPRASAEARSLATSFYSKALELYEDARERNQLGAAPEYGALYLEIADVLYAGVADASDLDYTLAGTDESLKSDADRYSELERAEHYYNEAEALFSRGGDGSRLPDRSLYHRAYIRYLLDIDGALVDFHRVVRRRPEDYEARLALATVLLESGDYEASRSQYARTIELLDEELRNTGGYLNPLERQGHEELLIRYITAWNNLGVGRARSAARGGGDADYGAALTAFTMASEYYDRVYSDEVMASLHARGVVGMRDENDVREDSVEDGRVVPAHLDTYPYVNRLRLLGLDSIEAAEETYIMYTDIPSELRF